MLIGRVPIEDFRVEGAAQPAQHRLMFLMARVAQDFEHVRVAAHASAILRRTGACAIQAFRTRRHRRIGRQNLFDGDEMIPGIAKVILVDEHALQLGRNLLECGLTLVEDLRVVLKFVEIKTRVGVNGPSRRELMQVAVGPAYRHLDDGVQPTEVRFARLPQSPPDRRFDLGQSDLQMADASTSGDRNARFNGCDHRAKTTPFGTGRQGSASVALPPNVAHHQL